MNLLSKLKNKTLSNNSKFLLGTLLLSLTALICKVLGAFYRVPLTNILQAEGMGVYQLIYPIFSLLLVVSTSGVPTAVSRLISEKTSQNQIKYANAITKYSIIMIGGLGLVLSLLMYILAPYISKLQGNLMAVSGYYAIAPSIFIVAIISVIRGTFQGRQNMVPTAISQIIEQVLKVGLGLIFSFFFISRGVEYAVFGALLGVSISELVAMLVLIIINLTSKKKLVMTNEEIPTTIEICKEIIKIAFPITLNCLILPLLLVIDSILIVNLLTKSGVGLSIATSQYGILTGVVNTIVNLPVVIASALSTTIVPSICASLKRSDHIDVSNKISTALKLVLFVSVPSVLGCIIFASPILELLFPSILINSAELVSNLLVYSSFNIILLGFLQVSSAILQCLNKVWIPTINLFVSSVIKVVLTLILVPKIGVYGSVIASIGCYLVAAILNLILFLRMCKPKKLHIIECVIFSMILIGIIMLFQVLLLDIFGRFSMLFSLIFGGIIYLLLTIKLFKSSTI